MQNPDGATSGKYYDFVSEVKLKLGIRQETSERSLRMSGQEETLSATQQHMMLHKHKLEKNI